MEGSSNFKIPTPPMKEWRFTWLLTIFVNEKDWVEINYIDFFKRKNWNSGQNTSVIYNWSSVGLALWTSKGLCSSPSNLFSYLLTPTDGIYYWSKLFWESIKGRTQKIHLKTAKKLFPLVSSQFQPQSKKLTKKFTAAVGSIIWQEVAAHTSKARRHQ